MSLTTAIAMGVVLTSATVEWTSRALRSLFFPFRDFIKLINH